MDLAYRTTSLWLSLAWTCVTLGGCRCDHAEERREAEAQALASVRVQQALLEAERARLQEQLRRMGPGQPAASASNAPVGVAPETESP